MTKVIKATVICLVLVLVAGTCLASTAKELAIENSQTDLTPYMGPVAQPPGADDQWDMLFNLEASGAGATGDSQCLGVEFAADRFFVTGRNLGDPQLYILDIDGALIRQVDLPLINVSWGGRDIAYDGTYLYLGNEDPTILCYDTNGDPVPALNIPRPAAITCTRAFAYDPATDHFYASNWGLLIVEFDRTGAVIRTFNADAAAASQYGFAWDDMTAGGPYLWAYCQVSPSSLYPLTTVHRLNPTTGASSENYYVPAPLDPVNSIAGGLAFTDEYNPVYSTLVGLTQGTPDELWVMEYLPLGAIPDVPAACENFTATPEPGGDLSCDLAWDLPTLTVNGNPISSFPLTSVEVERDGAYLATLPPTATSYTDNPPTADWYTYSVYAVNAEGDGVSTSATVHVGGPEFEEIPYEWIEINNIDHPNFDYRGTNTGLTADDGMSAPFDLGFDFMFYGNVFNTIKVCTNGFTTFTSTSTAWTNVAIPSSAEPNNMIAPYYDDFNLSGINYGSIWYYADPAGEFFVIEFDSMNFYATATGDYATFEVILYGPASPFLSTTMDFMYRAIEPGTLTTFPSASVGKENATGTEGIQVTYNGSGPLEPVSLMGIRVYGDSVFVGIEEDLDASQVPQEFALLSAYPNPFNPTTTISYALPSASRVKLTVYDIAGQQVAELVNGWRDMGVQEVVFDASNLASGVYLYNLTAGTFSATGKMVLMK